MWVKGKGKRTNQPTNQPTNKQTQFCQTKKWRDDRFGKWRSACYWFYNLLLLLLSFLFYMTDRFVEGDAQLLNGRLTVHRRQLKINLIPNKNSFECGPTRADFRWFPSDVSFQSVDWVNSALKVHLKVSIGWICERGRHDANSWLEWMKSTFILVGSSRILARIVGLIDQGRVVQVERSIEQVIELNWIESSN